MASKELKIREVDFIKRLVDSKSPTYANQTKSYQEAYQNDNEGSSAAQASHLVRKPRVQGYLKTIVDKAGAAIQDRVIELSAIYHGTHTRSVKTYKTIDSVRVIDSETVSEPSFMERVRAIDVLSKLAGDYDKRRVEADGALLEYRALVKGVFKGIKAAEKAPPISKGGEGGKGLPAREDESVPSVNGGGTDDSSD